VSWQTVGAEEQPHRGRHTERVERRLAEPFLQARAVDMTLGFRVAGDAEDAQNRPMGIGLREPGDSAASWLSIRRQIDVLVSKHEDLATGSADAGVVSRTGRSKPRMTWKSKARGTHGN